MNFIISFVVSTVLSFNSILAYSNIDIINPKILAKAKHAYEIQKKKDHSLKPIITVVDFTKPSYTKRFYVIDLSSNKILYSEYVSHGINSGSGAHVTSVSNKVGSKQTSVGVAVTTTTYYGKNGYSLKMHGLEKGINDKIEQRYIVIHGSTYVNESIIKERGEVGHSWGCLALDYKVSSAIINLIKGNSLVFVYYPDSNWLKTSKYLGN